MPLRRIACARNRTDSAAASPTQSSYLLPMWALGLAFFFMLIARQRYPLQAFAGVCALGIAVHIIGDVITAFGTMIFAPFSIWRAQIPTTFIIDPYFTSILVAGLIASVGWKSPRTPALVGLGILAAYVAFQGILHGRAVAVGKAYVAALGLESAQVYALPQPLSPFNWMVVVQQPRIYHLAYVHLLRNEIKPKPPADASWFRSLNASYRPVKDAQWQQVPRYGFVAADVELAEAAWNADALAPYRGFALFPAVYRVERGRDRTCVWFNDLCFALVGRTMPFRYGSCRDRVDADWKSTGLSAMTMAPNCSRRFRTRLENRCNRCQLSKKALHDQQWRLAGSDAVHL